MATYRFEDRYLSIAVVVVRENFPDIFLLVLHFDIVGLRSGVFGVGFRLCLFWFSILNHDLKVGGGRHDGENRELVRNQTPIQTGGVGLAGVQIWTPGLLLD